MSALAGWARPRVGFPGEGALETHSVWGGGGGETEAESHRGWAFVGTHLPSYRSGDGVVVGGPGPATQDVGRDSNSRGDTKPRGQLGIMLVESCGHRTSWHMLGSGYVGPKAPSGSWGWVMMECGSPSSVPHSLAPNQILPVHSSSGWAGVQFRPCS